MIELHVFGPGFGLPDPSPFCMKADILLQMSGLPHRRVTGNFRKASKGKLPLLVDDGVTIPDSSFIRFHLEQKHGIDFDRSLTPEQRGIAWSVEKMLEDHLYWIVVQERWLDDGNFARGPSTFFRSVPSLLRPLVMAMTRRKIRSNLAVHGMGRHSEAERAILAERAIGAVSGILGGWPYLMGGEPCGADATLGAFLISGHCPLFETRTRGAIERHPNLVAYMARIRERYFSGREKLSPAA